MPHYDCPNCQDGSCSSCQEILAQIEAVQPDHSEVDHPDWPPVPDDRRRCEGCGDPVVNEDDNVWHEQAHPDCRGGCGHHLCWCSDEHEEDIEWKARALKAEGELAEAVQARELAEAKFDAIDGAIDRARRRTTSAIDRARQQTED